MGSLACRQWTLVTLTTLSMSASAVNASAQAPTGLVRLTTMSAAVELAAEMQLRLLLDTDIASAGAIASPDLFLRFLNLVDLQAVGQGRPAEIDTDVMFEFIKQSRDHRALADAIAEEFQRTGFRRGTASAQGSLDLPLAVGGFFAAEAEFHQEPDGRYVRLQEINQLRIYFSKRINTSDGANQIALLAEWNPVPEEVVHQPDELVITRDGESDAIRPPEPDADTELIQFEQLYARVDNVGGSGIDLTLGQFRNPFGIWSDYTSHRNFTTTKNNTAVNGFALKKIELGVMAHRSFGDLRVDAALVHGRQSRTSDLPRADDDNVSDVVGRVEYEFRPRYRAGASVYLGEMRAGRNIAIGGHYSLGLHRLLLSGELVYQRNSDVNDTFGTAFSFSEVSSLGSYVQLNYSLTPTFDVYGMYEAWSLKAGDTREPTSYKAFQGLRYTVNPRVRWVVFEFGRMFWEFDAGTVHASSQLELTF